MAPSKPPGVMRRLWLRAKAMFRRAEPRELAPGRFERGSTAASTGAVSTAPLVAPRREYLVYVPKGHDRGRRLSLVVLCHGCRQTPEDLAGLTGIAERADREGWLVLLPRQAPAANPWQCWNWFDANTARGAGEAAIGAAQIVEVRRRFGARRERVWIGGLSAGAALAAAVGLWYPRLVRGVFAHSGLACGAAASPRTALDVMRNGPDGDVAGAADRARAAVGARALSVPLLVVTGDNDNVVGPGNHIALARQYLRFNGHPAGIDGYTRGDALPAPDATAREGVGGRHRLHASDWLADGRPLVRHVAVEALGHAWSGGRADFNFSDPLGPDALDLLSSFASVAAPLR
ncbi:MAG: PHB depolymerase family esterase [Betaproteobacteria bacterium]